jgi:hypothetical protein
MRHSISQTRSRRRPGGVNGFNGWRNIINISPKNFIKLVPNIFYTDIKVGLRNYQSRFKNFQDDWISYADQFFININ